ncbi:MAG: hypothetical protein HY291_13045 [Planctomycetes bacterium]|nr:hypothetical protein [Planctomycetota bacterium]
MEEPAAARLKRLEANFDTRYKYEPKLPSSALLTGAVAMACGFGAVMFFMFAWANHFERWVQPLAIFATLALALGFTNRILAKRWFAMVQVWSAEREALLAEIEALRLDARKNG